MTEREKIAARIRALLAKTVENGCTEDEAIAAAHKAAEMLERYNLTIDEVKMREIVLKVTLKVDDDVRVSEAKEYALDALQSMGGCRHPDDPFFSMRDRVKVVLLTRAGRR